MSLHLLSILFIKWYSSGIDENFRLEFIYQAMDLLTAPPVNTDMSKVNRHLPNLRIKVDLYKLQFLAVILSHFSFSILVHLYSLSGIVTSSTITDWGISTEIECRNWSYLSQEAGFISFLHSDPIKPKHFQ